MGTTELINVPFALYAKRSCGIAGTSANVYNDVNHVVRINADATFSKNGIVTGEILHAPGYHGTVILVASAGDVLSLRNQMSAATFTLQTVAAGMQSKVNASMKRQKLNN